MKTIIRKENESDYEKVAEILDLAFKQNNESILVNKLRNKAGFISDLSLVAEINGEIVGHILFTPIKIKNENDEYESIA